jgi:hypothetical protein
MRPVLAVALLITFLAPGVAAGAIAFFRTPSGNIGCIWTNEPRSYLRCDVLSGLEPPPARPRGCEFEWSQGLQMNRRGPVRRLCAGDTAVVQGARKLAYGSRWKRGGFTCDSLRTGLVCANADGHGWLLSRGRWNTF